MNSTIQDGTPVHSGLCAAQCRQTARPFTRPGYIAITLAVLTLTASARGGAQAPRPPLIVTALVFDGVTVIDVEHGTLLSAQRVVLAGNRIRAVGDARQVALPPSARVVDARGKYLIPGLWNMHVHIGPPQAPEARRLLALYLVSGVTGIRDAGSPVPLDTLIRWRSEVAAGTLIGPPRQLLSGVAINQKEKRGLCMRQPGHLHACVTGAVDARHLVDSLGAVGADMIKSREVNRNLYAVIAAAARRIRLPFGGHATGAVSKLRRLFWGIELDGDGMTPLEASRLGARIIDHEWGDIHCQVFPRDKWEELAGLLQQNEIGKTLLQSLTDSVASVAQCQENAREFQRHGTWFVPTLLQTPPILRGAAADSIAEYFTRRVNDFKAGMLPSGNWLRAWPRPRLVPDSGSRSRPFIGSTMSMAELTKVPILAGTDFGDGMGDSFGLHAELTSLVAEGLSSLHALQSATLDPAKMWHATDSLGTVAPGKLADLVLLDADPLADITNTTAIRAVVANGRYFDRAALDNLWREAQAKGP